MDENRKPWRPPFQLPMKKVIPISRKDVPSTFTQDERIRVANYLLSVQVEGMRKHLCFCCVYSVLYDKHNNPYKISRSNTLEEVKKIVEEIIKINAQ